MRVADYIVAFLESVGIEHIFTVCGGGSIFMCDALGRAKSMRYIACHHEQGAAMAAEAYARVRTQLGCAMVTSGPGGTNAITGVAGAWLDHVPVILISGQVFSKQTIGRHPGLRTLGVQEINIVDLVRPITKYAVMVDDPKLIRFHLEQATYMAMAGRPGPVWLDIPADVQNANIDVAELMPFQGPDFWVPGNKRVMTALQSCPNIGEIVDLLRNAKRPLVHIGQGIRLSGAEHQLLQFLDRARIPVVTARNGNDLIDSDHPLYVGRPGTFAQRGANFAVQTCDVYLAIGTRLSLAQTGYNAKDYARNAKIVMVDIDRAELDKDTVNIYRKVQCDAAAFLNAMNNRATSEWPDWSKWLVRCKAWQMKYPPVTDEQRNQARYVNSYHLVEEISRQALPGDVIVTDMGFAFQNTHQAFLVKAGQRLMTNCGLAPMGWGLPAAIGAAIGSGRRVILITGDGGLMMNVQELATLEHHQLNVKTFLLNNGGYLTMRQSQANAFDRYMGSDNGSGLSFPNFETLADSFGIRYLWLSESENVQFFVKNMLANNGPAFCEVSMDPDQAQIPKSVNRRDKDGNINQTAIEDAWPYLPAEEIAEQMRAHEAD